MKSKKPIAIILSSAILCSCSIDSIISPGEAESQGCILEIGIDTGDSPGSRSAETYTGVQPYESTVNNIQLFIYGSSGKLDTFYGTDSATGPIQINTTAGQKTVWAIVNGPDLSMSTQLSTMEGAGKSQIDLNDNSITGGFVMAGCVECNVSASGCTVSVPVRRFVSRIALQKITSMLPPSYGQLNVKNVFLANVTGNQDLSGTASPAIWYNMAGRMDGAAEPSMIIGKDGCQASCPDLTFRDIGHEIPYGGSDAPPVPYLLYCYPNGCTSDTNGWSMPFMERKTRLIISASISGIDCYYPVTIDLPERNTTYTVEITITGPGSSDPDIPVIKGDVTALVSIDGWNGGAAYTEKI